MINLSIVIATLNRQEIALNLLDELRPLFGECEIIIIDDGSDGFKTTGELERIIKSKFGSKVLALTNPLNLGTPTCWNRGIAVSTRNFVLTIPDDVHIKGSPLKFMAELRSKLEQAEIVGLRVIDKKSKRFHHDLLARILWRLCGQVFPPTDGEERYTDFVSGAMAFRKGLYFDEGFGGTAFREETDLQIRARKIGWRILYAANLCLLHDELRFGGQSDKGRDRGEWEKINQKYFLKKHFKRSWPLKWFCFQLYLLVRRLV